MKRNDLFSEVNQLNARRGGQYDAIAATAEETRCVFCDLKDKYILFEKEGLVVTVNIFPYIDGHLLVIPRRHVESFKQLTKKEIMTNFELTKTAVGILEKELGVKGFWMVLREGLTGPISGKTVKHLHWNILPYIEGLNTWHYQEITSTPQDLASRLRPLFKHEEN
jgi:diadenosine tetraphosphate (Ap4A) HIT family hydrolase